MSTLADYTAALALLVPGTHPVAAETLAAMGVQAVSRALAQHSKHRPLQVVEDVDGDGGGDYALSDLAAWAPEISVITRVEYPVDEAEAIELDENEWSIYETPDGPVLRLASAKPAVGETLRIGYTAPHTATAQACTVAAGDEDAVKALAASFYCKALAAAYALDQDNTIEADSVAHSNRSSRFSSLSRDYRKEYEEHMGIQDGKPRPACRVQDQDVDYPGGMDRITHPRRYR